MAIPKSRLATKRDSYVHNINIYKRRRDELRKKYGFIKGEKKKTEYGVKCKNLTVRISRWNFLVKRINKKISDVLELIEFVKEFTGVDLTKEKPETFTWATQKELPPVLLARCLYFKYGVERKLSQYALIDYIGSKSHTMPYEYRTAFTKSFRTNKAHKQIWQNFKKQYEVSKTNS